MSMKNKTQTASKNQMVANSTCMHEYMKLNALFFIPPTPFFSIGFLFFTISSMFSCSGSCMTKTNQLLKRIQIARRVIAHKKLKGIWETIIK